MAERKILSHLGAVTIEEEATFEVDPASSPVRLRLVRNIAVKPSITMIPVENQKSGDMRGPDPQVVGGKMGTLSFEVPLFTVDTSASPLITVLKRMGMELRSVALGSTLVSGGSANTITFADADAITVGLNEAAANIGKAVHHDSAAGTSSIRFAKQIVSDAGTTTVTVNQNFASTPVASDSVQAMDAVVPKGGDPDKTFAINVYLGAGSTNRLKYQCTGCAGTWKITTTGPKNLPVIAFEWQISSWVDSEANLAQASASGNSPAPPLGAIMLIDGTAVKTRSFAFDPGITLDEIESFDTNGRQGWNHADSVPVLEFSPLHDTAHITKWEAGTTFDYQISKIVDDTDAWALWCPKVQVLDYDLEEAGRLLNAKMGFQVCDPETGLIGATATDIPQYVFALSQ